MAMVRLASGSSMMETAKHIAAYMCECLRKTQLTILLTIRVLEGEINVKIRNRLDHT